MSRRLLIAPDQVARILSRMAFEMIERNRGAGTVELFGVRTRGTALAEVIAAHISTVEACPISVSFIDVAPYRDDRDEAAALPDQSQIRAEVEDRDVILVDDVLFTGRTARAAMNAVLQHGRPRSLQLAVLVDRGHREYPIQPTYIGRTIPTKHKERILMTATDGFSVYLEE